LSPGRLEELFMKKIIYAVLATISGLVLIFSYRTSLDAVPPVAATGPGASSGTEATPPSSSTDEDSSESNGSSSGTSSDSPSGTSETTGSGMTDGTYTGDAANTRYGPVQVQITVSSGVIADVRVIEYPDNDRRDVQINQRALPILVSETTQKQSSQIDMVSGATYTSEGYIASLQSAIDQANR
jgi:uncharacterized protein with FMN-binding domain